MSRFRTYLLRMALSLAVVLGVAAMLWSGVAAAFLANKELNGLIVVLFFVGVVFVIRSVLVLGPEANWIEQFQAASEGGTPPAHGPRLLAPMARVLSEQKGKLSLSAMSMRSLLDGIQARLDENREISRYLIQLLIFLGLLGTFWGLLKTIGAVAEVIAELSIAQGDLALVFDELKAGLEAPLGGMGIAFSSSLFGLAGSLALGFLELQATQAQNRFYNELEDWLSGVTRVSSGVGLGVEGEGSVPAYLQALIEQTAENLDTLRRTIGQGEEGRRQANANLMALTERLGTLTDQMRTEQNLMIRLAESQMELKPILGKLADGMEGGLLLDEATRQHIRNLDVYLHRMMDDMPSNRDQIIGEIRGEIKLLARTIAALAEEGQ